MGYLLNGIILLNLLLLLNYSPIHGQCKNCKVRANDDTATVSGPGPKECATKPDEACITNPIQKTPSTSGDYYASGKTDERTNSIQDFCVFVNIYPTGAAPNPPKDLGTFQLTAPPGSAADCYPTAAGPVAATLHSAGPDPNWQILEHLAWHHAQSYQPWDDLPFVQPFKDSSNPNADSMYSDGFITLDPSYNKPFVTPLPTPLAPNPYFIEVSGISFNKELLHNFLHFRIFANLSVTLSKDQVIRDKYLHGRTDQGEEKPNFAKGKIAALLIMVKDQDGWPVGDFSTPVPCGRTCSKYSHEVYYGDERNAVPCGYTPPYATRHPGMFVFDADPGRYCTHNPLAPDPPGYANPPPPPAPAPGAPPMNDPRLSSHTARVEGVREVHATWSFAHDTCNYVTKLYIQTLIFEDVETVYKGEFTKILASIPAPPPPAPGTPLPPSPYIKNYLFGWSAQYNILKTTRGTLGAPDYVDLKYFRERDDRANEIDCHVPLFDSKDAVSWNFEKFYVPSHATMWDVQSTSGLTEDRVPSRLGYMGLLTTQWKGASALRYMGQHGFDYPSSTSNLKICRAPATFLLSEADKKVFKEGAPLTVKKYLTDDKYKGERCPCPALPSTIPPENRTADPARLHGRLIHASHMAIAYMLLTPIACFVVRYYKETFITVFCFQEYWWYMWHVVILMAACLFNVGAITSIARKGENELVRSQNLFIHIILGAMSIFVFYMEIITGFFRVANPKKRMRQIFTHWLIGMTNNACAVMSMYAMAWVNQSGFSCNVAYTTTFWLIFVITCYIIMEVNMRKTDKRLRLVPRRTYLPPPVKRLFTKEPPGRAFRLAMMGVFIFGLIIIQCFLSYYIWSSEGGASCEEEYKARFGQVKNFDDESMGGGDEGGDDGGDPTY